MPLKAVFFGASSAFQERVTEGCLDEEAQCTQNVADMDDTLVLTSDADAKACVSVGKLANELLPEVCSNFSIASKCLSLHWLAPDSDLSLFSTGPNKQALGGLARSVCSCPVGSFHAGACRKISTIMS